MKPIKDYYNEYKDYDKERTDNYHNFIRELEIEKITKFAKGKKVLEIGCGTGLVLGIIAKIAKSAEGVDLSSGMLKSAKEKGLKVTQANVINLPFKDNTFDVVYSLKVLPHVPKIREALKEISRVTKKKGVLILEFYNPFSMKFFTNRSKDYLIKNRTFSRYDTINNIKEILPKNIKFKKFYGIRIFTPFGFIYRMPLVSNIFKFLDKNLQESGFRNFGGYFLVILEKS